MRKPKILIVDDEEDVIRALEFRLNTAGYETLSASNGAEALQVIQGSEVDLVLADFMMPDINGLELTRVLKKSPRWSTIKVVLFSCNSEPEPQKHALELGALDYLSKMDGASSIVRRVYDILGPEMTSPALLRPQAAGVDESSISQQFRSFSEDLLDFLHRTRASEDLSPSTRDALDNAERLAEDLKRLATSVEASRGAATKSSLSN